MAGSVKVIQQRLDGVDAIPVGVVAAAVFHVPDLNAFVEAHPVTVGGTRVVGIAVREGKRSQSLVVALVVLWNGSRARSHGGGGGGFWEAHDGESVEVDTSSGGGGGGGGDEYRTRSTELSGSGWCQ